MSQITTKTKDPTPEPDWSTAPETARWWAVDSDGTAYWFVNEPFLDEETGVWDVDGFPRPTRDIWFRRQASRELDPADTLHQRPEEKEEGAGQDLPQPDWSTAPDWADYWAVDKDGAAYWYEYAPEYDDRYPATWELEEDGRLALAGIVAFYKEQNQVSLLYERPAEEKPQLGPLDQQVQVYHQLEEQHGGWILPSTLRDWAIEALGEVTDCDAYEREVRIEKLRILRKELPRLKPYLKEADADADD